MYNAWGYANHFSHFLNRVFSSQFGRIVIDLVNETIFFFFDTLKQGVFWNNETTLSQANA